MQKRAQITRVAGLLCGSRSSTLLLSRHSDQLLNPIAWLCAHTNPIVDAVEIKTQGFRLPLGDWIVETNSLHKTTVARARLVCNCDVIKGLFFAP